MVQDDVMQRRVEKRETKSAAGVLLSPADRRSRWLNPDGQTKKKKKKTKANICKNNCALPECIAAAVQGFFFPLTCDSESDFPPRQISFLNGTAVYLAM